MNCGVCPSIGARQRLRSAAITSLVVPRTNRVAIGARIKVTVQNEGQLPRTIWRTVGSGGSFGSSPLEQHIGLGKSAQVLSIDVFWPVSKTHQTFHGVAKNQFLEIRELSSTYVKLDRKSFQLGAKDPGTNKSPLGTD